MESADDKFREVQWMVTFNPLTLHPNFKCIHPVVAEEMDHFGIHFGHHNGFSAMVKTTTPWEMKCWKKDELESFEIDLKKVDRLYHIRDHLSWNTDTWEYIIRMQRDDDETGRHQQPLYIHLSAQMTIHFSNNGDVKFKGGGFIFISRDANTFMKIVLRSDINKGRIYRSLEEDGVQFEELTEFEEENGTPRKNVPSLTFLCHDVFNENRHQLRSQLQHLPELLRRRINDFINLHDAKQAYRNISWSIVDWPFSDDE